MLYELYSLVSPEEIYKSLNVYPHLEYNSMQELIRRRYHISNILFGSGSEELIFRVNREILSGLRVAVVVPIFYRVIETLENEPIYIDVSEYVIDGEFLAYEFIRVIKEKEINAVWIANPNSIYGSAVYSDVLLSVIKKCPEVLFIIDEVSIDFLYQVEKYELLQEAEKNSNLIVIKSMSKYYGVPGLRLGMLSSNDSLINKLKNGACVYPVNNLSFLYLRKMLENDDKFLVMKQRIRDNAERLKGLLQGTPIKMLEPMTNTAFLWCEGDVELWELLMKYNIVSFSLKNEEHVFRKNAVRLTIHSGKKFEYLYNQIKKLKKNEYNE